MTPAQWERVKQVLETAWERDISDRATFLDAACAGDPELHAHVEALLAADDSAANFLEAPAIDLAELASVAGDFPEEDAGWIGQMVGPYTITALWQRRHGRRIPRRSHRRFPNGGRRQTAKTRHGHR